jgi:DNA-binding CsgD family transcriptional regulator/tetratricopeptide (TPR) repeat protein
MALFPANYGAADPMLIERGELLTALETHRADAARGSGRFVLIRGEAGIGKTVLARAFLNQLPDTSRMFTTQCENLSTPRPLAPLHEAVPALGEKLGRLLAEDAPRIQIAAWVMNELSSNGFRAWLVEDLQWADDATLDLLRYLGRRIHDAPVLMIGTYREDERPRPALTSVLGDLASVPAMRQVRVPPLSRQGVATMASGRHANPSELHRLTNGNPFYVTEVLAAGSDLVPISVRDAIRARIGRLERRAGRALEAAAILGSSVEPWLVAAVSGEDLPGIDDCLAAGLVRSEAGSIAFHHELTRVTVLEDLPVFRGIGLHRRALEALRQAGEGDEARLAYHAEGAADADAVLRHAGEAAERALAMRTHREAAQQLQRCLRFGRRLDAGQRLDLNERVASALFMTGQLEEADAARSEAIAACRLLGDVIRLGNNLRRLASQRLFSYGVAEALPLAWEALELLEPLGETRELALTYCALGHIYQVGQRQEEVARWSQRALELGRRLADAEVMTYALNDLGTAELFEGRVGGREHLERSLELARTNGLSEHIDRAMINLAETSLHNRELSEASEWVRELEDFTAASQIELCNLNGISAAVNFNLGRWGEAERYAEICVGHQKASPADKAKSAIVLASIHLRRGQEEADARVSDADAFVSACTHPDFQLRWPLASLHAEAAWLAGDMDPAVDELNLAYDQAVEHRDLWAIGDLGRWLWKAGQRRELSHVAAAPYALEVAGDWRAAMIEWERRGIPYEAAICRAHSDDAADLRESHSQLLKLGAHASARQIALKLRTLGAAVPRGPRRSTRGNPGGLTAREAEIAELAVIGLTNREIADQLVLTEKTVGHHISAVLGKLGARRRGDIASLMPAVATTEHPAHLPI